MVGLIAAVSQNGTIGKDGGIPWKSKVDLNHFRDKTVGSTVIMGRKTWDSLPKKPLRERFNVVLTRKVQNLTSYDDREVQFEDMDLEDAITKYQNQYPDRDIWVIGGSSLYQKALSKKLPVECYVTFIQQVVEGDTFFPLGELRGHYVLKDEVFIPNSKDSPALVFTKWVRGY